MIGNLWNPGQKPTSDWRKWTYGNCDLAILFRPPHCTNLGILALIPAMRVWEASKMAITLAEADIAEVLTYERLIPAMERALADFSAGKVIQPVRNMLPTH